MISTGALDNVKQIAMEIHYGRLKTNAAAVWGGVVNDALPLSGLRQLYEQGYKICMRERNLWSFAQWPGVEGFSTNVNEITIIKPIHNGASLT